MLPLGGASSRNGVLYISVGDNTNPFASDGYTPIDERAGRAAWDAQRTSSNTRDLRGKILRIIPQADGSYRTPDDNLFSQRPGDGLPEIFVMGVRNPFRMSLDAERGWLYWGDVGPDAGAASAQRGPEADSGTGRARPATGWPYHRDNPLRRLPVYSGWRGNKQRDCGAPATILRTTRATKPAARTAGVDLVSVRRL